MQTQLKKQLTPRGGARGGDGLYHHQAVEGGHCPNHPPHLSSFALSSLFPSLLPLLSPIPFSLSLRPISPLSPLSSSVSLSLLCPLSVFQPHFILFYPLFSSPFPHPLSQYSIFLKSAVVNNRLLPNTFEMLLSNPKPLLPNLKHLATLAHHWAHPP